MNFLSSSFCQKYRQLQPARSLLRIPNWSGSLLWKVASKDGCQQFVLSLCARATPTIQVRVYYSCSCIWDNLVTCFDQ